MGLPLAAATSLLVLGCTAGTGRPASPPSPAGPTFPALPDPPLTTVEPARLVAVGTTPWQYARAAGETTVDVYFLGSASGCRRLANVRVAETAATVTVTLFTGTPPERSAQPCPAVGVGARTRVPLRAPLGTRGLLDGSTRPPATRSLRP